MFDNKNVLAIIPARGGSKGIKLKNIIKIKGIPLIGYSAKVIQKIKFIDRTVVSTDSQKIKKVSEKYGLNVPFMRPKRISGDRISDVDVIKDVLGKVEKIDKKKYHLILLLQPTAPFRKPKHVRECIKKLCKEKLDSVWTVSPIDLKNHPKKQLRIKEGNIEYYEKGGEKIIARQQLDLLYIRNGYCYVMTRECIVKNNSLKGKKTGAVIIKDFPINIDENLDLKLANFFIRNR